jgi:hypothetical protein
MKRLSCPACGRFVHFDSLTCLNCGTELVHRPPWRCAAAASFCLQPTAPRWLQLDAEGPGGLCASCALTEILPDLSVEATSCAGGGSKRPSALVQALLRLGLPFVSPKARACASTSWPDRTCPTGASSGS